MYPSPSSLKTSWQLWKFWLSRRKIRSRPSSTKHLELFSVFLDLICMETCWGSLTAKDTWRMSILNFLRISLSSWPLWILSHLSGPTVYFTVSIIRRGCFLVQTWSWWFIQSFEKPLAGWLQWFLKSCWKSKWVLSVHGLERIVWKNVVVVVVYFGRSPQGFLA